MSDGDCSVTVSVKMESECVCTDERDAMDTAVPLLYAGYEVKKELVIGPEQLQPQDVAFTIQQSSNETNAVKQEPESSTEINAVKEEPESSTEINVVKQDPESSTKINAVKQEPESVDHLMFSNYLDTSYQEQFSLKTCYVRLQRIQVMTLHTCVNCRKTFRDKSSLTDHNCIIQEEEISVICKICQRHYIIKSSIPSRDAIYTCDRCRKMFYTSTDQNILKIVPKRRQFGDDNLVSKRKLKPNPCIEEGCIYNCQDIEEDIRKVIFEHYWSLSRERQDRWILSMTRKAPVKTKQKLGRRNYNFEYFINDGKYRRKVCQKFFLNTLGFSQKVVYNILADSIVRVNNNIRHVKKSNEGTVTLPNYTNPTDIKNVKKFIKDLHALPLYLRKNSTKLYLPAEFKHFNNVYQMYKKYLLNENIDAVNEEVFTTIVQKYLNYGIHVRKKNKCVKCERFETETIKENKKLKLYHLKEIKVSEERFYGHQELGEQNPEVLCTSFDLQNVLNTPYGESSLLYYSGRLSVYNECFYENETEEGLCFIWSETNGRRGANEIATILQRYIEMVDSRKTVKYLILYADSNPRQNLNREVLAAIHNSLSRCHHIKSIQMNYLLQGHAVMPVNTMQSTIEGSVKNCVMWAPSQWATVCQVARTEQPYQVNFLDYSDFKEYTEFSDNYFEGNLTGKISNIRIATFKKSCLDKMDVKYSMRKTANEERILITKGSRAINQQLYEAPLPISEHKYNDLKKLCDDGVIPRMFRDEFLNLPISSDVMDTLNETDVEDELED